MASPRSVGAMLTSAALAAAAAGLLFSMSLIVAIGPQNTYVLRVGLQRHRVLTVVTLCALSDAVLIAVGVAGAGSAMDGRPWVLRAVRIGGALFLLGYGARAARRVLYPVAAEPGSAAALTSVVGTALAFTWLNPGVYLDTLVLLGSVANTRPGHQWWFGGGAALASSLWFAGLGYGSRLLTPLFTRRRAWQALDAFVAVVMVLTGLRVLLGR